MVKRSADWKEGLAEDLRDPELAREFLLAAVEEGVTVQKALGKVIRAMGVKEYAEKAGTRARTCCGRFGLATIQRRRRSIACCAPWTRAEHRPHSARENRRAV